MHNHPDFRASFQGSKKPFDIKYPADCRPPPDAPADASKRPTNVETVVRSALDGDDQLSEAHALCVDCVALDLG